MFESCRLLEVTSCTGPENMAIDEALLQLVGEGRSPPTLRFYVWTSAWISLGSGQSAADVDLHAIHERGWGIVRRASGGTAVLHQGQLGYALVLPSDHPVWRGDLIASYERLSRPFQQALRKLGVETVAALPGANAAFVANAPPFASRVCFGALGAFELTYQGRKLIGNSQIRRRLSSAQHGVIQIDGAQTDISEVIASADARDRERLAEYLTARVTSLSASAGRQVAPAEVEAALIDPVACQLDRRLEVEELTRGERELSAELVRTKFGDPAWTYRL